MILAVVDIYLSGVWSCFNVLQKSLHSSWGVNSAFCGALPAGHGQMPGVISAFVILTQFKRSSVTQSQFQCVWRDVTLCCMLYRGCSAFLYCVEPCKVSASIVGWWVENVVMTSLRCCCSVSSISQLSDHPSFLLLFRVKYVSQPGLGELLEKYNQLFIT